MTSTPRDTERRALFGRTALVTGCGNSHGIGFTSARALAEHGAAVAVTSTTARIHERATELAAAGYTVDAFVADLTVTEQTASLVEAVGDRLGPVDILAYAGGSGYAAAKAGMDGLTRTLALELGPHGVTVNSVAPGWIVTSPTPSKVVVDAGRCTPVGRAGRPDEVAAVIAFLAEESASYLTGQSIVVEGGNIIQEHKGRQAGDR